MTILKVLLIIIAIAGILGGGKKTLIYSVIGIIFLILKIRETIILKKNPDSEKAIKIRGQLDNNKKEMAKFYEGGLAGIIMVVIGLACIGLYELIIYFEK